MTTQFYWNFPATKTAAVILNGQALEGVYVEVTKWQLVATDGQHSATIDGLGPVALKPITDAGRFVAANKVTPIQLSAWFEDAFGEGAVTQARYRAGLALAAAAAGQGDAQDARGFSTVPEHLLAAGVADAPAEDPPAQG